MFRKRSSLLCLSFFIMLTGSGLAEARQIRAAPAPRYSALQCDAFAIDYARHTSSEGQLLVGTGLGGLAGFAIGSIFAASGVGAAIGVPVGLLVGVGYRAQREKELYAAAYQDCMMGSHLRLPRDVRYRTVAQ